MVVDLSVDGENDGTVLRFEGLRSGIWEKSFNQLRSRRSRGGEACEGRRKCVRWRVRRDEGD